MLCRWEVWQDTWFRLVVSSDAAQDLTESNKYPARLRGAISSGWGLACIISEIPQSWYRLWNIIRKDSLTGSRKEASVYERIPYEPGSLMILQVAKRIVNIRFDWKSGTKTGKEISGFRPLFGFVHIMGSTNIWVTIKLICVFSETLSASAPPVCENIRKRPSHCGSRRRGRFP